MDDGALIRRAIEARERAYAPYSSFAVGAALLAPDGRVFTGCNVENRTFALTLCAERNAVFQAVAAGVRRIEALAVVSGPGASMCGACRQVVREFADADTRLLLSDTEGRFRETRMAEVLPDSFGPEGLGVDTPWHA